MRFKAIIRDPLGHFLIGGLLIYFFLSFGQYRTVPDEISISRADVLEYIQLRNKTFDDDYAKRKLLAMSPSDLRDLIAQMQIEEALYREATILGLEQGDYVIRQRLVGKIKYLTAQSHQAITPDKSAVEAYYTANLSDYLSPASVTFTHVFFSKKQRSESALRDEAVNVLKTLQDNMASPSDAKAYGDRFLYNLNYVERNENYIRQEFGETATEKIFSNSNIKGEWFGPVMSDYGAHLVYIIDLKPVKTPLLANIFGQVEADYIRAEQDVLQRAMEKTIASSYDFNITPDLKDIIEDAPLQSPETP